MQREKIKKTIEAFVVGMYGKAPGYRRSSEKVAWHALEKG
jgi:hypothetical protein